MVELRLVLGEGHEVGEADRGGSCGHECTFGVCGDSLAEGAHEEDYVATRPCEDEEGEEPNDDLGIVG